MITLWVFEPLGPVGTAREIPKHIIPRLAAMLNSVP